jgi:transcriptional regulator with XRE-family HTH domain
MPWKEVPLQKLAKQLGVDYEEVREKHRLIRQIAKLRKAQGLSQAKLATRVGVSQSRIAQIESGIGTATISFDILFRILGHLGYDCRIVMKLKAAA